MGMRENQCPRSFILQPLIASLGYAPKVAILLPCRNDYLTKQGFLGSNFQPGIRNCIAAASSREPEGSFR